MYLWLYCELLSFIFHRHIGSQELYEMSGGAIWHKNPILSACLCETPATYSQSLSGGFNTVSDAFAFFYTIYANTKWPEGWPTDQIPILKISKIKVFYFGRETIPESSQIPMRLLRIWYWWHSSYHFFCKSLEQSFCMITVINIECQTFKNGETGVIGNPKFEVWPRLPWHSSSHFNWKRVSLKDRQNRWWAEGAIGYPNFGPEIQVILISSFWKTSLEQRSLSLARKYRYPLCY